MLNSSCIIKLVEIYSRYCEARASATSDLERLKIIQAFALKKNECLQHLLNPSNNEETLTGDELTQIGFLITNLDRYLSVHRC